MKEGAVYHAIAWRPGKVSCDLAEKQKQTVVGEKEWEVTEGKVLTALWKLCPFIGQLFNEHLLCTRYHSQR